ncbi:Cyclin-A1-1 like [Heracleum sosnowskyi]|uniref:Cyclin-A1-1 like n=1 Tax=Heracleum sosnowskyi TaxID=360622 RepID=A0AAD8HPX4_9APIA|nr:Cyclin-A1-1 like [Heracleum sosnowskyi]
MSTQKRVLSRKSMVVKRQSENVGKVSGTVPKKRPALANITNQRNGPPVNSTNSSKLLSGPAKGENCKKGTSTRNANVGYRASNMPAPTFLKPCTSVSNKNSTTFTSCDGTFSRKKAPYAQFNMDTSSIKSDCLSVALDGSMSSSESLKSPEVEYIDNTDVAAIDSIERKTYNKLCISDDGKTAGSICKRDILAEMETGDRIVDVDENSMDPQLCATLACDIYKHLRASEVKKRPSTDFMETVQKDINASMRAILVDWLVEVAEEYKLVPETLYLTVNYVDRYLSGNSMDRQKLQLLGVACMMIASKYEEICPPQVEEFCYITDNTYFKDEVLEMESTVLNFLRFEMTAATAKCFLRRFVRVAQAVTEAPAMQLECMTNYLAELTLLEYHMLRYAPSMVAASAIFLARYILFPSRRPWNSTLCHYTLYKPSDLLECVGALHSLCCNSLSCSLPAIREKYSQHNYKCVAKKFCPSSIPRDYFQDL